MLLTINILIISIALVIIIDKLTKRDKDIVNAKAIRSEYIDLYNRERDKVYELQFEVSRLEAERERV